MTAWQSWHAVGHIIVSDPQPSDPQFPLLRYDKNGNEYVKFTLMVPRGENNSDFFACHAFRNAAIYIARYGMDGSLCSVIGQWEQKKVRLDDKECPHCHQTLNARIRDWYRLNVFKIQVISKQWRKEASPKDQSPVDPFASFSAS